MVAQQESKETTLECIGSEISPSPVVNLKNSLSSPKSRLAMLKRSSNRAKSTVIAANDPFRFQGNGLDFKGKLIGERDVAEARGDVMCTDAMRMAKASIKSSGNHKPRIILNISIEGLKIKDEKSGSILYNFPVSKISFIARDTTDARAFGFIFGTSDAKYKFYGIKTAQTADHAVLAIRDMFQVVYEMKKKQIQEAKQKKEEQKYLEDSSKNGENKEANTEDGVVVADLLNLEAELPNLEQGFNQLQNIPRMPEDDLYFDTQWCNNVYNSSNNKGSTMPYKSQPLNNMAFNSNMPLNFSSIAPPTSNISTDFFEAQWNSSGGSTTTNNGVNGITNDVNFAFESQWKVKPEQKTSTNPFNPFNPFDDSFFNASPSLAQLKIPSQPPTQEKITTSQNDLWNDNNGWRVKSLEEAFTKLVNMDQLISANGTNDSRKNPFEHIINPPKMPLNALIANFP